MTKTRAAPYPIIFLIIGLFISLPGSAWAQATWKWMMSLRIETRGDSLYMPSAVGFDDDAERYYAVDTGNERLVSFDREGKLLRAFTADDQLRSPFDMVRLDSGVLWVVEKGRNSLTRIDIAAREVKPYILWDGEQQVFPDRIAQNEGVLYVLDRASGQVLRLGPDLGIQQRYGCSDCEGGISDFVLQGGSVWALEGRGKKAFRFRPDGSIDKTVDLGDPIVFPVSLAVDPSGYLYVLDRQQCIVAVYDREGRFRYQFLGPGQSPGRLYFPRQVRFDPWGHLCVVDEGNGRVEVYTQ